MMQLKALEQCLAHSGAAWYCRCTAVFILSLIDRVSGYPHPRPTTPLGAKMQDEVRCFRASQVCSEHGQGTLRLRWGVVCPVPRTQLTNELVKSPDHC